MAMNNFKFRKAITDDADQLAELSHQLNLFHKDKTKPAANYLHKEWDYFDAYVVETDGEILGFLGGCNLYLFHMGNTRFDIHSLYVKDSARRKGIGRMLFENTILEKYKEGIRKFSVEVSSGNTAAQKFYASLDFQEMPPNDLRYVLGYEKLDQFIKHLENKIS